MKRLTKVDGCGENDLIRCFDCNLEKAGENLENCGYCEEGWRKALDRLAAYEDTGLEPEEIERIVDAYGRGITLRDEVSQRIELIRKIRTDRLRELAQADKDGRLVVLDEPKRPLLWGDKERDTLLCPRCLCDLMGGFEYAPSSEIKMVQCPHCGCPVDSTEAVWDADFVEQLEQIEQTTLKGGADNA